MLMIEGTHHFCDSYRIARQSIMIPFLLHPTAMTEPKDGLALHRLTHNSPDIDTILPSLFALSLEIFPPDPTRSPRTSEDVQTWWSRLEHPSSSIIYISPTAYPTKPIALIGVYPRQHEPALRLPGSDHTEVQESMHVWLAGVREDMRARGCLGLMMREFEDEGAPVLTVCTFPSTFPNMWAWLRKRGWTVEREFEDVPGKVQLIKVQETQS